MGYDYDIVERFKPCKHCGRYDVGESKELYTSYNHSWAFYAYLDKKHGLRWIYGKSGKAVTKRLETMLECLEHLDDWEKNFDNAPELGDGWAITSGNAYWFAKRILETAKALPKGVWGGD